MSLMKKLFGDYSSRELKSIYPIVDKIDALADEYKAMSDAQLKAKTRSSRTVLPMARPWTTFCLRPSPPSGRLPTACWVCVPTGCSWWAASCCTRAASLK